MSITADSWYASLAYRKCCRGAELAFQVGVKNDRIVSTQVHQYQAVSDCWPARQRETIHRERSNPDKMRDTDREFLIYLFAHRKPGTQRCPFKLLTNGATLNICQAAGVGTATSNYSYHPDTIGLSGYQPTPDQSQPLYE